MPLTLDDVAKLALALPDTVENDKYGNRTWCVPKGKKFAVFAWERGFSKADIKRFGDQEPPQGPNIALRVDGLHEKEAILAEGHAGVFTIEHFDNYPLIMVQLKKVTKTVLKELLVDAWLSQASPTQAEAYLATKKR